jgi:hypothetical protein
MKLWAFPIFVSKKSTCLHACNPHQEKLNGINITLIQHHMKKILGFKVYGWMNFFTSDLWMKIVQLDGKLIKSNKKENN